MTEEESFEKSLERLREIVSRLNSGETTLDETVKLFEEGVKLSEFCRKKLEEAKLKIETLSQGMNAKKKVYRSDEGIDIE
jgi:exodeoxyribonuclease VII small subunit